MNIKGQSMLGALVSLTLIGIASLGLIRLMGSLSVSQARVQRAANWNALQNNVSNTLRNLSSCSLTVLQVPSLPSLPKSLSILLANGTSLVSPNANLGFQLTNANATIVSIGAPTAISVTQTVNQVTQSPCGQTETNAVQVTVTQYVQQAQITISALYLPTHKPYSQVYYINTLSDTNGHILGCN